MYSLRYGANGRAPVVVAFGAGVDSTAMLCGESISSHTSGGFLRH